MPTQKFKPSLGALPAPRRAGLRSGARSAPAPSRPRSVTPPPGQNPSRNWFYTLDPPSGAPRDPTPARSPSPQQQGGSFSMTGPWAPVRSEDEDDGGDELSDGDRDEARATPAPADENAGSPATARRTINRNLLRKVAGSALRRPAPSVKVPARKTGRATVPLSRSGLGQDALAAAILSEQGELCFRHTLFRFSSLCALLP
jgi:hypothetical protein